MNKTEAKEKKFFVRLKNSFLKRKLIITITAIIVVLCSLMLFAMIYIINNVYLNKNIEREFAENEAIVDQISKEIRLGIYNVNDISLSIYTDSVINTNVQRLFSREYDAENFMERINIKDSIENQLQLFLNMDEAINCIQLYIEGSREPITVSNLAAWQISSISKEYSEKYKEQVVAAGGKQKIILLDCNYTICVRALGAFNHFTKSDETIYTLVLVLSDSYVDRIMDKLYYSNYSSGKMIFLIDQKGNITHSTDKDFLRKNVYAFGNEGFTEGMRIIKFDNEEVLCTAQYNEEIQQYITIMTKMSEIDLQARTFRNNVYLIIVGITVTVILLLIFFSMVFVKPIQSLINNVNRIGVDRRIVAPIDVGEGGNLSLSFNEAIKRTEAMVKANYQHIINEKNARIAILQLQINPHFIFNALDTINWSVYQGNTEQSELLISSLGKILRYTTYNYDKFVPLIEEISVIKNFINFERQRHNDFKEYIFIENDLRDFKIPCLLIQPLVENACKHGLRDKEGGKLFIRARRVGDQVEILVADNGKGVTPEKLKEILAPGYRREDHIGLVNVRERVQTVFGSKAVFSVTSVDGWYFKVRMLLPVNGE